MVYLFILQVPYNQEILSRARKSGSTGIETETETDSDSGDKLPKVPLFTGANEFGSNDLMAFFVSLQPEDIERNVEQAPVELNLEQTPAEPNGEQMPTKTRFSGRKNFADFFDSTTQIIETKV